MSATQRRFGAAASKHRSSRSDGRSAGSPGSIVVGGRFRPGLAPRIPSSRISRSTVHRATGMPWLFSSSQIFRAVNLPSFLSFPHFHDLLLQARVTYFPRGRLRLTFLRVVIRRHGEFQDRADRLDTEPVPVRINELD